MTTGEVEVRAVRISVLNPAKTPPFYINEESDVDEALRLRYRYLDLRRERMAQNLRMRHRLVKIIRDELDDRDFLEIETPILIKSTPEGARDYLVPSRVNPGHFYALPQSPQQLKQLLMVAGVERYFQIARCFRDEDLRADRQPEFTQLDLEMSFVDESDILSLMEILYVRIIEEIAPEKRLPKPFPRITHAEALERYGSDKPDLRFGMQLHDLSEIAGGSGLGVLTGALEQGGVVKGILAPGSAGFSRRELDQLTDIVREHGARGLVSIGLEGEAGAPVAALQEDGVRSAVSSHLSVETVRAIGAALEAKLGDLALIVAGPEDVVRASLSALRNELGERLGLADPNELAFAFVTDFPLFEWHEDSGRWGSAHHPFTAPRPEDIGKLDSAPGEVLSRAYDAVVNGYEVASGSIRIHDQGLQGRIFGILGYTEEQTRDRFGHLLEAFEYGAPPHGGFASGIDRLAAVLAGDANIREVIPFPKTQTGQDLMTSAPSIVNEEQLADLHLEFRQPS
jgi:aspartyl-tRNA synthetase